MKLWWHELHQITGAMALNWNPTPDLLISWAKRLEAVAKEMKMKAKQNAPSKTDPNVKQRQ